jgi:adenylate cyclase
LAEGGGICISGSVYDQVENKLALTCEFLGEQQVKNIARPVRVHRVHAAAPPAASSQYAVGERQEKEWRRATDDSS